MVHDNKIEIIKHFGYDPTDQNAILKRAKELVGKTLQQVLEESPSFTPKKINPRNKGDIGNIIQESWFGFSPNSSEEPDFLEAGIELKIIPLEVRRNGLVVKERTKICAINYNTLIDEEWISSHAKKKLEKVLFIYFQYDEKTKPNSKVEAIDLWVLNNIPEKDIIRDDWTLVRDKVDQGLAHELSESLNRILAACRSGSGGIDTAGQKKDLVTQPKNTIKALRRSFSLKQSYTRQRWEEISKRAVFGSVVEALQGASFGNFETLLLKKLHQYEGMQLSEFARKFNFKIPSGKGAAATIVKKAIGFKNVNARMKELDQTGTEVRVLRLLRKNLKPMEAVSFPAFVLKEFEQEEWESSELIEYVDRILFMPMLYENKDTSVEEAILGKAFIWEPSFEELKTIEKEWRAYQAEVKAGKAKVTLVPWGDKTREVTGLTKESGTKIVHIRPHGLDKTDRDEDSYGNSVVKQSFWLNKDFIAGLVNKYA